ncbi:hypothetical protein B6E66_02995 [Streptomyces maremycinicus]|uniref:hypothetical protein n=1 Tax=Streptomyces maremycinicus TaxID=1679753 RepID=UPI0007898715|nr:hypothetical protein [Streptomyces sp. NBRC 110468]OQR65526.1 hypothetical protein B6E66_02995 [Streptomyces sp. B9173]
MRIRSVLAATVLGIALATTGATSALADEGPRQHHEEPREYHHFGGDEGVCSPYIGAVDTSSADIFWAGKHCDRF